MSNPPFLIPSDPPPLPPYVLAVKPPIVPHIPDSYLAFLLPALTYWVVSLTFHYIDVKGYCVLYRLHTPAEYLKRNRASKADVIRVALFQQICQCLLGVVTAKDELSTSSEYDLAVWARRVRFAQRGIPGVLSILGIDSQRLAMVVSEISPSVGAVLLGGWYTFPGNTSVAIGSESSFSISNERASSYARWELITAQLLYYILMPTFQFFVALILSDTWQYVTHRLLHANKFLYSKYALTRFSIFPS